MCVFLFGVNALVIGVCVCLPVWCDRFSDWHDLEIIFSRELDSNIFQTVQRQIQWNSNDLSLTPLSTLMTQLFWNAPGHEQ